MSIVATNVINFDTANPLEVVDWDEDLIPAAEEAWNLYNDETQVPEEDLIFAPIEEVKKPKKKGKKTQAEEEPLPPRLYPVQFVIGDVFLGTEGITALRAPMGTGKTLLAANIARQANREGNFVLIIVPTTVLSTWFNECRDYGLMAPSVDATDFFLYDAGVNKPHQTFLESRVPFSKKYIDRGITVICKDSSTAAAVNLFGRSSGSRIVVPEDKELIIISDEAHNAKKPVLNYAQPLFKKGLVKRELLMSGSIINPKRILFERYSNKYGSLGYTIDHRINLRYTPPVPAAIWHMHRTASRRYANDPDEWEAVIQSILDSKGEENGYFRHCVVAATVDEYTSLFRLNTFADAKGGNSTKDRYLDNKPSFGPFRGRWVYPMTNTAKGKIPKFSDTENSVLALNKTKITGINISSGDTMIIFNAGDNKVSDIQQLVARLIRPKNPNKEVHIHVINGSVAEELRCLYAKAYSYNNWDYPPDEVVNVPMVAKACALLRALNEPPASLSVVDLCIFLADYTSLSASHGVTKGEIIQWWKDNEGADGIESITTEDMIEVLWGVNDEEEEDEAA